MAFLRKALGVSPRQKQFEAPKQLEEVPQRPAWETRQPLSRIGSQQQQPQQHDYPQQQNGSFSNRSNQSYDQQQTQHQSNDWSNSNQTLEDPWQNFHNEDTGYHSNPSDLSLPQQHQYGNILITFLSSSKLNFFALIEHSLNLYLISLDDTNNNNTNNNNSYNGFNDDGYYDDINQAPTEEEFPQMDDDLEAAFAKSVNELRSNQMVEDDRPKFEDQGQRGNIYRMVANALEDKSKLNNGKFNSKYLKVKNLFD